VGLVLNWSTGSVTYYTYAKRRWQCRCGYRLSARVRR